MNSKLAQPTCQMQLQSFCLLGDETKVSKPPLLPTFLYEQ